MPDTLKWLTSVIGAIVLAFAALLAWLLSQWRATSKDKCELERELRNQTAEVHTLITRIHELEQQGRDIAIGHFERLHASMLERVDQLKGRLDELQRRITAISEQMDILERRGEKLHWDYIKLKDERDIAQDEAHQIRAHIQGLDEATSSVAAAKGDVESKPYWPPPPVAAVDRQLGDATDNRTRSQGKWPAGF